MSGKNVTLAFGAMCEPLSVQLEEQGIAFKTAKDQESMEKLQFAINVLHICGYVPDSQVRKMHQKLMKDIMMRIEVVRD